MIQAGFKPKCSCPRPPVRPAVSMVLGLHQNPLEGWAPFSNKMPGDSNAAGPQTTLEDPLPQPEGELVRSPQHQLPGGSDVGDLQVTVRGTYTLLAVATGSA